MCYALWSILLYLHHILCTIRYKLYTMYYTLYAIYYMSYEPRGWRYAMTVVYKERALS